MGVIRIAGGLLVIAAVITQIVDDLTHSIFVPSHYFAYFTIQSSLMNVVVLMVGGYYALRHRADTELLTSVRMSVLAYAIVTGAVYNLLLRGLHVPGYRGLDWPNEVLHVVIPLFILVDWLVTPGRQRLRWKRLWFVASYPLAWLAFTMIRGGLRGWYPYPFLDPNGPGGWPSVIGYVVAIAAIILGLGAAAIATTRRSGDLVP
jgi:hypothetical protein